LGHVILIVISVLGTAVFFFAVMAILFDFSDTTGWQIPRPRFDWQTLFFCALAISGFTGLAYVIWSH